MTWQHATAAAAAIKRARETCPNGHPWTEENTYNRGEGQGRGCRICRCAATGRYGAKRREWLESFKRATGCIDCGTTEGRLDLDHRLGETKLFDLSQARVSWDKLHVELAKCDVRCIACHSRRHGLARGGLQAPRSEVVQMLIPQEAA